jgi:GR25 family glycosyltransferase involved in LPS biosynthesis
MDININIKHAFYINLESRPDRRIWCETQLQSVGIQATRFNAIKLPNGAIGCSMSHLKCLHHAKEHGWDHLLIVEDDIEFTDPQFFKTQLDKFLTSKPKPDWDVVLLAGNNMPPYEQVADYCAKVTACQTTTGYIVNGHYFDTLIKNIKEGLELLIKNPEDHKIYALDKYWFKLQEKDKWFLITPLTVIQREDYSDIEERVTNYQTVMLDLDKKAFFSAQLKRVIEAEEQLSQYPTTTEVIQQFQHLQKVKQEIEEKMALFYNKN